MRHKAQLLDREDTKTKTKTKMKTRKKIKTRNINKSNDSKIVYLI